MNYSIIGTVAVKYGMNAIRMGILGGACFLSYGFGLLRGERRVRADIDEKIDLIGQGIKMVIDEKKWKESVHAEMEKTCAHPH
jgi:hypothetical protein